MTKVPLTGRRAVLYYFDFDLGNPGTTSQKLQLLERLLFVEHIGIILISAVDPMYYLASHNALQQTAAAAAQTTDQRRWAVVLSKLRRVQLVTKRPSPFDNRRLKVLDSSALDFIRGECEGQERLCRIGRRILLEPRERPATKRTFSICCSTVPTRTTSYCGVIVRPTSASCSSSWRGTAGQTIRTQPRFSTYSGVVWSSGRVGSAL